MAVNGGISASNPPDFPVVTVAQTSEDNGSALSWTDKGTTMPGLTQWHANTPYTINSVVTPIPGNGHYYQAVAPGTSGSRSPAWPTDGTTISDSTGGLSWQDKGTIVPGLTTWVANTAYAANSVVTAVPSNGHYYIAATPGVSASQAPTWPVDGSTVSEVQKFIWLDSGTSLPASAKLKAWYPKTPYFLGDIILDPTSGHYLTVISPGIS